MLTVTLLANAGVLIDTGGLRLLADGLYSDTGHTFSTIPDDMQARLTAGKGEFANIRYLLFTHLHPDHFDRHNISEFTEKNGVLGVFFPSEDSPGFEMKEFIAEQNDNEAHPAPLTLNKGEALRIITGDDIEVTAFCTGHIGIQYSDAPNICYLLKADGKTLLITGDADNDIMGFAPAAACGSLDAIALNPLFMQSKRGAELLRTLQVKQVILYHIPFEGQDPDNLRVLARHQALRYKNEPYTITPLTVPMQSVSV